MKYRKLRIAWSVGWGVVTVLLIVLWVRSYKSLTGIRAVVFRTHVESLSVRGRLSYHWARHQFTWSPPTLTHMDDSYLDGHDFEGASVTNRYGFGIQGDPRVVYVPHWFVIALTVVLATLPWFRHMSWRFSLRTLLIATTLVAAVLGAVVYAMR